MSEELLSNEAGRNFATIEIPILNHKHFPLCYHSLFIAVVQPIL